MKTPLHQHSRVVGSGSWVPDALYVCIDVRIARFTRFKYIRDERGYDEQPYIGDFSSLPLTIIDAVDDPKENLDILHDLILQCIERHAPLKRTKVIRSQAPWLHNYVIRHTQLLRNELRHKAHSSKNQEWWLLKRK